MKQLLRILTYVILGGALAAGVSGCRKKAPDAPVSTKAERNYMKKGKELFDEKRYADAEVSFKKALEENPANPRAAFNLASSYLKQRGDDSVNKADSLVGQADRILAETSGVGQDVELSSKSFYDRGNIAYRGEDYAAAIEMYKNALRRNPEDNQARENLRMAQLKKKEQDQNKDNQQNQDQQNQNQNKDQNKDQQNQDQNKDQQNQDQNQDQNQNKDQNKDQNQQPQNQDNKQQQQQQQQSGLSDQSAQQILKAMDAKESGTREKVEKMKYEKERQQNKRTHVKPW